MQKLMILFLLGCANARLSDDKCKELYKNPLPNGPSLINKFPHMGLLGSPKNDDIRYSCPVTLISDSFAITPAVCLTISQKPKYVLLGTLDPKSKGDYYKLLEILEATIHPDFDKQWVSQVHNIGLVKFSPPVISNDYIRPGCLYTKNVHNNQNVVDLLWGTPSTNQTLFKVESSIVPIGPCKKAYETKMIIDKESQLCTNRKFGNDFKPHIGGTSHLYEDDIPKIVAIDSFGPRVPSPNLPDISTKIYNYLDWIERIVWNQ